MSSQTRCYILGFTLVVTAIVACFLATSRTNQAPLQELKQQGGLGSAEEAFDVASMAIQDYVFTMDSNPIWINPQFRATLHSKSKLWTIKGFATLPNSNKKFYHWTVILNYHDMQEWEVLAKIVTPEIVTCDSEQVEEGVSQAQGKLFQSDCSR